MHRASSSAVKRHASIRQESGKLPEWETHGSKDGFVLGGCSSRDSDAPAFEMVGVHLNAADQPRTTETKHSPLPARHLEDSPLVCLQGDNIE